MVQFYDDHRLEGKQSYRYSPMMTTGWGEAELLVQFYDDHRLEGKQSYWYSSMMTTGWRGSRAIGAVL